MRKICGSLVAIIGVAFFASLLMAPVGGPTVKTPRLSVGTGAVPAAGNLVVSGTTTVTGNTFTAGITDTGTINAVNIAVSGTCTGCGGQQTTDTVALQFTEGCSNSPDINISWTVTSNVITVQFADGPDADCTSDATNFGTLANALPLIPFGDITEARRVKYTPLNIATVQTDACAVFGADRSVAFTTGVACGTAPGNVTKVVTSNVQNPLTFLMGS